MRGATGAQEIEAAIDTGFTDNLLLPNTILEAIGAERLQDTQVILANGAEDVMGVYAVEIEWFGAWYGLRVFAADADALIGVGLLKGCELRIEIVPGGSVEVTPL